MSVCLHMYLLWPVSYSRRWKCGVTKKDTIRNELVGGSVELAPVTKKIAEKMQVPRRVVTAPIYTTKIGTFVCPPHIS